MIIPIATSDDLHKLFVSLANQITDAFAYDQVYKGLGDSLASHQREFSLSNTFWWLALDGLEEARFSRLCRIYDGDKNSVTIVNLLDTIDANIHFFEKEHFLTRMVGNPHAESLATVNRIPSVQQINLDRQSSGNQNSIVQKLTIWRNNHHSHQNSGVALNKNTILHKNPIPEVEIDFLLENAITILNRYQYLFNASTWSKQMLGHDDYKSLLRFIKMGLEARDEAQESALANWDHTE